MTVFLQALPTSAQLEGTDGNSDEDCSGAGNNITGGYQCAHNLF